MAKSVRSKWKRKMRAVKRVRYAKRELEALKKVVDASKNDEDSKVLYTIVTKDELKKKHEEEEFKKRAAEEADKMETDQTKKFDKKTLRDENGQYPVWMNQRTIQKLRQKHGKVVKGKKKSKQKHAW